MLWYLSSDISRTTCHAGMALTSENFAVIICQILRQFKTFFLNQNKYLQCEIFRHKQRNVDIIERFQHCNLLELLNRLELLKIRHISILHEIICKINKLSIH